MWRVYPLASSIWRSALGASGPLAASCRNTALAPLLALLGLASASGSRDVARYGAALGADGLVRLVAYGALLSPRVLTGRGLGGIECEGPCVVQGHRLAFRVRRAAYATLLPNEGSGAGGDEGENEGENGAAPEAEGCVYRLSSAQLAQLGEREGGYSLQRLRVRMRRREEAGIPMASGGRGLSDAQPPVEAMVFLATRWDLLPADAAPSARYLAKMLAGAEARGLSEGYRRWLGTQRTSEQARLAMAAAAASSRRRVYGGAAPTGVWLLALAGAATLSATTVPHIYSQ
ncbi:hypothetical protein T492DRAFT_1097343 [Pavlovales sp. CCMP2436]|nr:hypothetical protein T492DRAFT_1097343 [Pavlovales sp. CCMP2436]|mmetsp:Transcript_31544/g.73493  ORF Transcript_31544/g.73493 Transcript_31544/m.73493 type:complete len:289 (-) Transcript_31544:26-892(-)